QSDHDGQGHGEPPGLGREDEQSVRAGEAGSEDGRLQVHLPAVTLPAAGRPEILVDPTPELELEPVVGREFQGPRRGRLHRADSTSVGPDRLPCLAASATSQATRSGSTGFDSWKW